MTKKKRQSQRLADLNDVLDLTQDILNKIITRQFKSFHDDEFVAMLRSVREKLEEACPEKYRSNFFISHLNREDVLRKEMMITANAKAICLWAEVAKSSADTEASS